MTDRFVLVDIETTGLDPLSDLILEVGFQIRNADLTLVDEYDVLLWESSFNDPKYADIKRRAEAGDTNAQFVLDMHTKSGLWDQARNEGLSLPDAELQLVQWLDGHGIGKADPMVGSSVHFDRSFLAEQLPAVTSRFSHRNIDVSTLKELCRRLNPEMYAKLADTTTKRELHRALPDIEDTVGELKWYIDNFLFTTLEAKL